ncbi:MAG: hypothetical protein NC191_06915 [Muribaculaceae bacterium]|nr:hypothetical protein [Muribaculaceae bacterium]
MGLAASQARLLTITSRKADCEFMSMTLSHQKLSLSRDMEAISNAYQDALSATKLVYDYQSAGSREMKLTYDLLMSPSVYNDYYPKLVTDTKNRVMLNSAYASAARAAGIPAEGLLGTPSSDIRNKFVQALAGSNVITPATAAQIQAVDYGNTLGLGNTISVSTSYDELNYEQLLSKFKNNTNGLDYEFDLSAKKPYGNNDGKNHFTIYKGTTRQENMETGIASVSLYDLLTQDVKYNIGCESDWGFRTPILETAFLQEQLAGTGGFLDWLQDEFATILGGVAQNDTALQYAYNQVYDLIYPDSSVSVAANTFGGYYDESASDRKHKTEPGDKNSDVGKTYEEIMNGVGTKTSGDIGRGYSTNPEQKAGDYIGFTYAAEKNTSGRTHKETSEVAINLNNLAKVFLTSYVQYMQGIDNSEYSWDKGALSASNLFDDDSKFKFTVLSDTQIDDGGNDLYAAFYDALFNMICTKGWVQNDQIEDVEYMSEMMKNGMAFISSLSDDGFYYQSTYSNEKNVIEVSDDEAIAQAEAKYNSEKAKIENKEQTLDLKMKNLDTEISALTQEYDAVKNLVTKGVEKSFKRYEA